MAEDELERLAAEELLKEAKRGAERAKEMGSLGWQKTPVPPANKVFLKNITIRGSSRDRKRKRSHDSDEYHRSPRKEKYPKQDKHYKDYNHHKNSDYKKDHGHHRENKSSPTSKSKKKSKKSHRKKSSTKHKHKKHRKSYHSSIFSLLHTRFLEVFKTYDQIFLLLMSEALNRKILTSHFVTQGFTGVRYNKEMPLHLNQNVGLTCILNFLTYTFVFEELGKDTDFGLCYITILSVSLGPRQNILYCIKCTLISKKGVQSKRRKGKTCLNIILYFLDLVIKLLLVLVFKSPTLVVEPIQVPWFCCRICL
ncbi:LOW QUALITY PROTEIN: hypothetical protein KUTeg_024066 [Tegillarca granosa]|uniref:Uncharacterized protein n=1 Tax=Tegillarca granosa TaxID=220873 RepID=A0ABQ9E217_TEGGR|nr:LOW QUALITY PROTEIN: hypothetical protein KUTeg_024066 [Tegillarca granosa]